MTSQQLADELLAEYWAEKARYERDLEIMRREMECKVIYISDLPQRLSEALS